MSGYNIIVNEDLSYNILLENGQGANGAKGDQGIQGNGITNIARTAGNGTAGSIDTYTITFTNGTTTTYTVLNGANGSTGATGNGISTIVRTSGTGLAGSTDTYTITFSNGTTTTYNVVNGANGAKGDTGPVGPNSISLTTSSTLLGIPYLNGSTVEVSNVDNTSDVNKPISTATQTALNLKADTLAVASGYQPLNTNLNSIAALTTTTFGRSLLTQNDATTARTTLGAGTSSFNGAYGSLSGIPSTFSPSSHIHGNITNEGAIGSTANLPLLTTTSGIVTTGSFGTDANTFCVGNDSRLSDARTPLTHLHAGTDITTGTVDPARLGSGSGITTKFLRGDSTWQEVTAGIGGSTGAADNRILRSDGTGGATLQATGITVDDSDVISGVRTLELATRSAEAADGLSLRNSITNAEIGYFRNVYGTSRLSASQLRLTDDNSSWDPTELKIAHNGRLGFQTSIYSSSDVSISRLSPGVLRIGTTAANALGSLNLTNLTASGTVTTGNVAASGNITFPTHNTHNLGSPTAAPATVFSRKFKSPDTYVVRLEGFDGVGLILNSGNLTIDGAAFSLRSFVGMEGNRLSDINSSGTLHLYGYSSSLGGGILMPRRATETFTPIANTAAFYSRTVGGATEAFVMSSSGVETQLTGERNFPGNITASGTILAGNGTAALPSHSFTSFPGGGMSTNGSALVLSWAGGLVQVIDSTSTQFVGNARPYYDDAYRLGSATQRWKQIFVTQAGVKIGDGTNGPTITASGTSPNEAMVFTPGGGSGAQFVKNGVTPLSGNGSPQGDIATFRGAANRNWRIFSTGTGISTDTINDSQTSYGSWGLNAIDIELNSAGGGKVKIGGGTGISKVLSATATLDFPSIASNDTHTLTMTVMGAVAGDSVFLGCPAALEEGLIAFALVTAADTVTIKMHNSSGSSVNPASGLFRATVLRF